MPSAAKITQTDGSEDTSPTESTMLGPDSSTDAGGGDLDKQGGALVIPEKSVVGENMINETGVAVRMCQAQTQSVSACDKLCAGLKVCACEKETDGLE